MVVSWSRTEEEGTDAVFAALSDSTRRDILRRSAPGQLSVSALARRYPLSVTAVQKHVAVLERAGLVTKQRRGREQIVRVEADGLARAQAALDGLEHLWRERVEGMDRLLSQSE